MRVSEFLRNAAKPNKLYRGYVLTDNGTYLVQIPDKDANSGFFLMDDDQSWDGGSGAATSWKAVPTHKVPQKVRRDLDWILE